MEAATHQSPPALLPAFTTPGNAGLTSAGGACISRRCLHCLPPPQLTPGGPGPPLSRSFTGRGHDVCLQLAAFLLSPGTAAQQTHSDFGTFSAAAASPPFPVAPKTQHEVCSTAFLERSCPQQRGRENCQVPQRGAVRPRLTRMHPDPAALFFLVPNEAPCLSHTALGVPRKGDALSWTTPVRAGSQEGSSPLSSGSQPKHTSQPLPQAPVGPPQAQACRVWLQVMLDLSRIISRPNQARAEGLQHKSQPGKRSPPSQTLLYLSTGSCAPLEPHLQGPGAGGTAQGSVPRRTPALARALNPPAPLLLIATRARRITRSVFTQPNCCIM